MIGKPWDSTLDEARSKQDEARLMMMNRNEELKNEALMSKQEAERAMQLCSYGKLKQEIQDLKSKNEEMETENAKLKTENEKLKEQVEDSVEIINMYGKSIELTSIFNSILFSQIIQKRLLASHIRLLSLDELIKGAFMLYEIKYSNLMVGMEGMEFTKRQQNTVIRTSI